jgi:hypothetical protein
MMPKFLHRVNAGRSTDGTFACGEGEQSGGPVTAWRQGVPEVADGHALGF